MYKKLKSNRLRRRGVLLIVVLSLLVLFALIGLTFVVVAGHYSSAARISVLNDQTNEQGRDNVEQVFYDLARGSNNANSFLFRDDDDSDGVVDEDLVDSVDNDGDGLIDEDPVGKNVCSSLLEDLYGNNGLQTTLLSPGVANDNLQFFLVPIAGMDKRRNAYSGRVITMLSGPAAGLSTRIAQSGQLPPAFSPTFIFMLVEAFENSNGIVLPAGGNRFVINGPAFGGVEGRDANETYDAPDRLNPHLAFIPADAPNTPIIPSFVDRIIDLDGDGVPSAGDLVIDNDMDGIFDSGWINPGYETKTAADGRRYRAMASILCIDLDGRLNLNAHGNLGQLASVNANYAAAHPGPLAAAATPTGPRGSGLGPADINLSGLFPGNETKYGALLDTRHGADLSPGPGGGTPEDLWLLPAYGLPNDYATSPAGYASPPDVFGGCLIGVDAGGRPVPFNAGLTGEVNASPYQIDLVAPNGHDRPFTADELERLLRWNDVDSNTLPKIWNRDTTNFADSDFAAPAFRRAVTTSSSHIPVVLGPADARRLIAGRMTISDEKLEDDEIVKLLPFEILHGGKFNVNRLWGNALDTAGSTNSVIDEVGEIAAGTPDTIFGNVSAYGSAVTANYLNLSADLTDQNQGRYLYARQLYTLMLLVSDADYKRPATETLDDNERRELTTRRIAQWAINCVNFRDPDSIMTPFEYDANPFNGWNVNGDPKTIETDPNDSSQPHPDRRLVWGCEHPDVLLTEMLAFHDRRMRNTEWDDHSDAAGETDHPDFATTGQGPKRIHQNDPGDNTMPGDKDLDQVRIPEGSLFFELYCTRNKAANNPVPPAELYTSGRLDLGKMAGDYPVWRVAISRSHHNAGAGATHYPNSPNQRRVTHPDTTLFQPNHPDPTTNVVYPAERMSVYNHDNGGLLTTVNVGVPVNDATVANLDIERYVWFSTTVPPAASGGAEMNDENTFYNRNAAANSRVRPGGYLVVGPRDTTFLGSKPDGTTPDGPITIDGDQSIDLTAGFVYTDAAAAAATPTNIVSPVQSMVAAINAAGYAGGARGLNVSEPFPISTAAGTPYPVPAHARESYGDGTDANLYPDEPLDKAAGRPLTELSGTPDDTQQTKKYENYRTAFLQRLANPLQRWNPPAPHAEHDANLPLNPYLTVDWQPIDLTVFNGEDRSVWTNAQTSVYGEFDPDDPDADWEDGGAADPAFGTRHRSAAAQNVWSPTNLSQPGTARAAGEDEFFQFNLQHTLGYLNSSYGAPQAAPALGEPPTPFPWLMWPNRPLVSHLELMLVPASEPSRLCSEITPALTGASPYDAGNDPGLFGHLLNFYHSSPTAGESGHFYRLLEYLEVPSPYTGAERWFPPVYNGPTIKNLLIVQKHFSYMPPFNRFSRGRDPGRVNINTMPGATVWEAIDNNGASGASFATYAKIDASRRYRPGVALPQDPLGRFNNAFRGSIVTADAASAVEQTLLRRDIDITPLPANPPTAANLPLLGPPLATGDYLDPAQHAYFRMQGLQRLGNILTTQSNVYAIWITVGYFEVDANGAPLRELGQDTGEIRRHRGFYIVDRSIPVAYERGRNHNVDKSILLRRYIE